MNGDADVHMNGAMDEHEAHQQEQEHEHEHGHEHEEHEPHAHDVHAHDEHDNSTVASSEAVAPSNKRKAALARPRFQPAKKTRVDVDGTPLDASHTRLALPPRPVVPELPTISEREKEIAAEHYRLAQERAAYIERRRSERMAREVRAKRLPMCDLRNLHLVQGNKAGRAWDGMSYHVDVMRWVVHASHACACMSVVCCARPRLPCLHACM